MSKQPYKLLSQYILESLGSKKKYNEMYKMVQWYWASKNQSQQIQVTLKLWNKCHKGIKNSKNIIINQIKLINMFNLICYVNIFVKK